MSEKVESDSTGKTPQEIYEIIAPFIKAVLAVGVAAAVVYLYSIAPDDPSLVLSISFTLLIVATGAAIALRESTSNKLVTIYCLLLLAPVFKSFYFLIVPQEETAFFVILITYGYIRLFWALHGSQRKGINATPLPMRMMLDGIRILLIVVTVLSRSGFLQFDLPQAIVDGVLVTVLTDAILNNVAASREKQEESNNLKTTFLRINHKLPEDPSICRRELQSIKRSLQKDPASVESF